MKPTASLLPLLTASIALAACASDQDRTETPHTMVAIAPTYSTLNDKKIPPETVKKDTNFSDWLQKLNNEARKKGIRESTLTEVQPFLKINPAVISFDQQQPEFTQTFWTYLNKRLNELRVQAGKIEFFHYRDFLSQTAQNYGVQPEILVAFWGLETNYGNYLGNFSTLEALTTLAFDPRRSDFFRRELLAALSIIDQGHISAKEMKGSWAGAIGQVQFMPTVFLRHAQDGNNDQKIDLWNSTEDALSSAAAFLKASGWQSNQPWGQEVKLPTNFDYLQIDDNKTFTIHQLIELGVTPIDPAGWRNPPTESVTLLLPAGYQGPAFATYHNFKVIKKWNRSNNYALTVGLLAERIANNTQLSVVQPQDARPWPKSFTQQLQQKLLQLGYDVGKVDGWFGTNTLRALRQFQQDHQLIPDGYPNETLHSLNIIP